MSDHEQRIRSEFSRQVDVQSAEMPEEAALHNALEILRDPSHVRMLPKNELHRSLVSAGLEVEEAIAVKR